MRPGLITTTRRWRVEVKRTKRIGTPSTPLNSPSSRCRQKASSGPVAKAANCVSRVNQSSVLRVNEVIESLFPEWPAAKCDRWHKK